MKTCRDCIHHFVCAVYAPKFDDVMATDGKCSAYLEKPKKPTIRHCKNCEWSKEYFPLTAGCNVYCSVKYKGIQWERITALLCRYYCKKEGADNG